jgi:periplasmic divalent cation tolerance protein
MYIIVLTTVPSEDAGKEIARKILEARLAACVNVSKKVSSMYWWEGRIEDTEEVQLFIKTKLDLYNSLEGLIIQNHPYKVPEIIAIPVKAGSTKYLEWISNETNEIENDFKVKCENV